MSVDPKTWSKEDVRPARVAYEEYYRRVAGRSVRGDVLPTWDEMVDRSPTVAYAWMCAAEAAIDDWVTTGRVGHPSDGPED